MTPCPHCGHDLHEHRAREIHADVTLMRHRCRECGCVVAGGGDGRTLIIEGEPAAKPVKCHGCSADAVPGAIRCADCDAKRVAELNTRLERIDEKVAARTSTGAPRPRLPERRDTDG